MKNKLFIVIATIALASCGAKAETPVYTVTAEGVGPITLGTEISALPSSCDGLYDRIDTRTEVNEWEDPYTYYAAYAGNEIVCEIYEWNGRVTSAKIVSPRFATESGLTCHSTVRDIFAAGGSVEVSNDGALTMVCDGVRFEVGGLTDGGQQKVLQAYYGRECKFTEADFADGADAMAIIVTE